MTAEPAPVGESLPAMSPTRRAVIPDRLERLRRLRDPASAAAGPVRVTGTLASSRVDQVGRSAGQERILSLARTLGGRVSQGTAGPVVVVEELLPSEAPLEGLRHLPEPLDPTRPIVCLDTETTGLGTAAGTLVFLVGLGTWREDGFLLSQLVLADQPDEPALLAHLEAWLPPDSQLVTYNGRAFDWPLLVTRYRLHRQAPPSPGTHLDLLPLARRVWRHRLPDARLASVEAGVCGVRRMSDLPGAEVPGRYIAYLRNGDARPLQDVLRHNRQDVLSLALLLRNLSETLVPAGRGWDPSPGSGTGPAGKSSVHPGDLAGLGAMFARRGRHHEALACLESALERLDPPWQAKAWEHLAIDRARVLARLGKREEAESAWQALALEGGRRAALAWLQVAKHREHHARDLAGALRAAQRAGRMAERRRLFGDPDRLVERDLRRRLARLRRKLADTAPVDPGSRQP